MLAIGPPTHPPRALAHLGIAGRVGELGETDETDERNGVGASDGAGGADGTGGGRVSTRIGGGAAMAGPGQGSGCAERSILRRELILGLKTRL